MQTLHASSPDDYASAVAAHPRLLVDFYKDNCPGCTMLDMSLRKFAAEPDAQGVVLHRRDSPDFLDQCPCLTYRLGEVLTGHMLRGG